METITQKYEIGHEVKKAMDRKKINVTDVNRLSGVDRTVVYKIVKGKNYTTESLIKVANVLDLKLNINDASLTTEQKASEKEKKDKALAHELLIDEGILFRVLQLVKPEDQPKDPKKIIEKPFFSIWVKDDQYFVSFSGVVYRMFV